MPTLFVLAAHIPDSHNQQLLTATLDSIVERHPKEPVLVVDNASPPGRVMDTLVLLSGRSRACIGLRNQSVSHGMIGSWHEADSLLRAADYDHLSYRPAHPLLRYQPACFVDTLHRGVDRVALLQHSTRLLRLPPPVASCSVISLSGAALEPMGTGWLRRSSVGMSWASAKALELRLPCSPRCTTRLLGSESAPLRCLPWDECDGWSAALHSTLLLSRRGFAQLASHGLWPRIDSHGKLVHNSSFSRNAWHVTHGEEALPHTGLEVLAGMLAATLNRWPEAPQRCTCTDCLEKHHGHTGRVVRRFTGSAEALFGKGISSGAGPALRPAPQGISN